MRDRASKINLRSMDQLFLIHIPKTAGTSLYSVLCSQFSYGHYWPFEKGESINFLMENSPSVVLKYRLFRAHHDYSVYKLMPRMPLFLTMLRDPVTRVKSLYSHIKRVPSHRWHREVVDKNLDFRQFLELPKTHRVISNLQVKYLAGAVRGDAKSLPDEALLEVAQIHLDGIAFFGITEQFEQSTDLLCHTFNWDPIKHFTAKNVAPPLRGNETNLDGADELIEEINKLDRKFYEYAKTIFHERITSI